ncbi:hypothetical protein K440DRAFT_662536 [Wilcoxina mikolae CBS 423.85]|nr:hypothetical protein K440DRAFT_662536 [Wilcoxina mikolae CBS 423.85]
MPPNISNNDKDFQLLLSIIANQSNSGAINWDAVAQECGYTNPMSCRNRMNALKKMRAPGAPESPKTSPKKKLAGVQKAVAAAAGTGKRGRPKKVVEQDYTDFAAALVDVKQEKGALMEMEKETATMLEKHRANRMDAFVSTKSTNPGHVIITPPFSTAIRPTNSKQLIRTLNYPPPSSCPPSPVQPTLFYHHQHADKHTDKMPMQWNDQADARLFANVLKLHVVKLDYLALAKAMGNGVTPKAISHRIAKIKEKANAYKRNNPYAFDPEPIEGSPSKRSKKSKKGKHGKGEELEDDDIDIKSESGVKVGPGLQTFYRYDEQQQQGYVGIGNAAMTMAMGAGDMGEGYAQGMSASPPAAEMFAAHTGLSEEIGERLLLEQTQEQQGGYAEQNVHQEEQEEQ